MKPAIELKRTFAGRLMLPLLVVGLAFFLRVHLLPSVPFGWHPDEATKGLMARDVLAGKYAPVFFSAFTGREPLYVYLEAVFFVLFGESILAGRLLSAFVGVLTVALTYAVGKTMFNRRVGLLGALLLAMSLWHLIASRNGYRAVIQTLVQLPAIWLMFKGWRDVAFRPREPGGASTAPRRQWLLFAVAGLFLGLSQYTYTAARFFPVLISAIVVSALVLSPPLVTRRWRALLLMAAVAFVVFLPLGVYFVQHPIDFSGRAEQISIFAPEFSGGDPWGRLWQSVKETALMFTEWGDPNYRFNLSGKPVFGDFDSIFFVAGLGICGWFALRPMGSDGSPAHRLRRLACVTLLLWLAIMLLPMTLSAEGLPYYQRAIGALPAVYFFPALTLEALAAPTEHGPRGLRRTMRVAFTVLCVVLTLHLFGEVYAQYFGSWHTATRNDDDRRVAMVYAADYLKRVEPMDELYLSSEYAEHPTLAFLAPERYDGIHWFDARQSLPLPPEGVDATYLFLLEKPPEPRLLEGVPDLRKVETADDRFGRPVFEVYRWSGGAYPVPSDQSPGIASWERTFKPGDPDGMRTPLDLPASFGDVMLFLGHDRSADTIGPGETLEITLYWHLQKKPERHYSIFVHLLDPESNIVGEFDANWYATSYWREGGGETLVSYFPLRVQDGIPAGEYQLEIGVYHQPTGERLPIYGESGEMVADRLLLRPVEVR